MSNPHSQAHPRTGSAIISSTSLRLWETPGSLADRSRRAEDAVDFDGFGEILELFFADRFELISVAHALTGLGADDDLAVAGDAHEASGDVGHRGRRR